MSVYEKIESLNISLPPLTPPVAAFVPYVQSGNLVSLSGHIAKLDGKPWVGQLGSELTTDQGIAAARAVAIDLLGTLHGALGDLGKIARILKLVVLVNSAPSFTEQYVSPTELPNCSWRFLVRRANIRAWHLASRRFRSVRV